MRNPALLLASFAILTAAAASPDEAALLDVGDVTTSESANPHVKITLSRVHDHAVTVRLATAPGTALPGPEGDYLERDEDIAIPAGVRVYPAALTIVNDGYDERNPEESETFTVTVTLGARSETATVTIRADARPRSRQPRPAPSNPAAPEPPSGSPPPAGSPEAGSPADDGTRHYRRGLAARDAIDGAGQWDFGAVVETGGGLSDVPFAENCAPADPWGDAPEVCDGWTALVEGGFNALDWVRASISDRHGDRLQCDAGLVDRGAFLFLFSGNRSLWLTVRTADIETTTGGAAACRLGVEVASHADLGYWLTRTMDSNMRLRVAL